MAVVVVIAKMSEVCSDLNILYLVEGVRKEIIEFCCDINAVRTRIVAMVRQALV